MKRKRGAQPNNHNALKHGFYSRNYSITDVDKLELLLPNLDQEIELLRVTLRRLYDIAYKENTSMQELLSVINALNSTTSNIGSLLRLNQIISKTSSTEITSSISIALSQILDEYRSRPPVYQMENK